MMTRNDAARWLLERDHFCILTHARPDGDTLGSASALCVGLRQLGKTAHLLINDGASPFLDRCQQGLTKDWPEEQDTLVTVDVATPGLLLPLAAPLLDRISLRIDHHATATSFTPEELVDPSAAACGEIVYDVLMAMGCEMTKELAWRLYIAVSTDTGCFRYSNTSANTYRVAAACAETGADLYPITQELFDTTSISELKLQNWMVDHATFLADGHAAVCAIPKELEESVSAGRLSAASPPPWKIMFPKRIWREFPASCVPSRAYGSLQPSARRRQAARCLSGPCPVMTLRRCASDSVAAATRVLPVPA